MITQAKVDVKASVLGYRATAGRFDLIEVPERAYLMVDGHGDPNSSPAYVDALAALYPLAYALKFASRRDLGRDYVVPPLEGLWWADDLRAFTTERDKSRWSWTMLMLVPDWLGPAEFAAAVSTVRSRRPPSRPPSRLDDVRLDTLVEGLAVQTLHVGSYDEEGPVLADLHERVLPERGLVPTGRHHEIYLSDARRTQPARLRTVLRQPVSRAT